MTELTVAKLEAHIQKLERDRLAAQAQFYRIEGAIEANKSVLMLLKLADAQTKEPNADTVRAMQDAKDGVGLTQYPSSQAMINERRRKPKRDLTDAKPADCGSCGDSCQDQCATG